MTTHSVNPNILQRRIRIDALNTDNFLFVTSTCIIVIVVTKTISSLFCHSTVALYHHFLHRRVVGDSYSFCFLYQIED